jgi:hypothetical protein
MPNRSSEARVHYAKFHGRSKRKPEQTKPDTGFRKPERFVEMKHDACRVFPLSAFRNPVSGIRNSPSLHEAPRQIYGGREKMKVLMARDFHCAEFLQVRREPLGVEESKAPLAQPFHQREQRKL